jgi:glycosyltransferase involved in cell wall biosynthesis
MKLSEPSRVLPVAQFSSGDLVSIIIPAFNSEPYLSATLASCRAQTHAALEIVVVDDGSTDDTAAIAQQIASEEPRLRLIRSSNQGQCAARNLGLSRSQGRWVKFLDSDDLLPPAAIARQLTLARRFEVELVCGGARGFWDHELPQMESAVAKEYAAVSHLVEVFDSLYELNEAYYPTFNEILLARSLVNLVGGFDARLRGAEELNLLLRISTAFPNVRAALERSPAVLMKRLNYNSLAVQLRTQRPNPWLLRSLRYAAEFYLAEGRRTSFALKKYMFDGLYHAIVAAYHIGLYDEAGEAWGVWRRSGTAVPPFEIWYHDWLHRFLTPRNVDRALRWLRHGRGFIFGKRKGSE